MSRLPKWMQAGPARPGQPNPSADGLLIPTGIGPAPVKPSQPVRGDASRRIILPGCDFPPAENTPYDDIQEADIANGASATIITVRIPDSLTLRIEGIGFGSEGDEAMAFISWQLNGTPPGTPITPYVNKPASIGSIQQLSPIVAVIGSSVRLDLVVTNTSPVPATYHYYARMRGWFYAEKEA